MTPFEYQTGGLTRRVIEVLQRIAEADFSARLDGSDSTDPGKVASVVIDAALRELVPLCEQYDQAHEEKCADEVQAAHEQVRSMQTQLVQAGRLAAMGELAAGIAHELNQPLTAIRGFAEVLVEQGVATTSVQKDLLARMIRATSRMGKIIDNIRVFGREQELLLRPTPARQPLEDALELLSEQLSLHGIRVEKNIEPDLPQVMADPAQLQQTFLNLLGNARDALDSVAEQREKRIELSVSLADSRVEYIVADNGPGVDDLHQDSIFELFFTTKPPGKGMGLGLSLTYKIIEDHRGEIRFETNGDRGARFAVSIPTAE